jgi:hypothetical protein
MIIMSIQSRLLKPALERESAFDGAVFSKRGFCGRNGMASYEHLARDRDIIKHMHFEQVTNSAVGATTK